MVSHFMMPPKMFTRTALTFGVERRIRKASRTWSLLAPPPTSRKLAGSPPWYLMRSIVLIASPGAVDEAGDVAVELNVAQPALAGSKLVGVFLLRVEQGGDVGVAEHGVVRRN